MKLMESYKKECVLFSHILQKFQMKCRVGIAF